MPDTSRFSPGATDTVVASAARTTSGNSGVLPGGWGAVDTIRAQLNVSAASGTTPNLVVTIEDTLDGVNWNPVITFAAKTAPGREVLNVATPFSDKVRVAWAITGTTPSFTFEVITYTE